MRPPLCESCTRRPATATVDFPGSTVEPFAVCTSCAPPSAPGVVRVERLHLRVVTA